MKIHRLDHVGVVVNDLAAAKAFFLDLGLEVQGEWDAEGELLDRIVGLDHVKTTSLMMRAPDGQATLELIKYVRPADEAGIQPRPPNTLGIRHIAFVVEDI